MTPIQNGLLSGYSTQQIIDFILKSFPHLASSVKKARNQGHKDESILDFLSKTTSPYAGNENISESKMHKLNRERDANITKQLAKLGIKAGIGTVGLNLGIRGLSALGQSRIGQNLMGGLSNVLGRGVQPQGAPTQTQQPLGALQSGAANLPTATQGQGQTLPQQIPATIQASAQQPPMVKSSKILQDLGLTEKINNLFKAGNNPEQISAGIELSLTPGGKNYLQNKIKTGEAKSLPEMVQDYLTEQQGQQRTEAAQKIDQVTPEQKEAISQKLMAGEQAKPLEKMVEQTEKPQKGSVVATPDGMVGEIKDIRNKEALVESDGKLHKVKVENLIESPLPEKDLAELHEELIKGIEKETGEEVSRNVNWAGYDPEKNQLAYLPYDGALYIYDNISPEEKEMLGKFMSTRKSTGNNFIGAWKEGTKSPIGAAMSALITKLQAERGGKGNEYSQKFPTVYNALEPALKAAKAKKRKKK